MMGWGAGGKWQKSFCTSNELSVLIVSSQIVIAIWTGKSSRGWMGLMQSLWCPSTIDSKTERSVATRREERRLEGQVTWKLTSAFHLLSILWSSSLLRPLPSPPLFLPLCPLLSFPCAGFWFWICVRCRLFLSVSFLSPSLSQLCCHGYNIIPYMKCICRGRGGGGVRDMQE